VADYRRHRAAIEDSKVTRAGVLLFTVCGLVVVSTATIADEAADDTKRQLVDQLMEATGATAQHAQMIEIIAKQLQARFAASLKRLVPKNDQLSAQTQARFTKMKDEAQERFATRIKDVLWRELPFSELLDRVYYPVFDKHFDEAELRQIIAFYQTDTGRKLAEVTSSLRTESALAVKALYGKRLEEETKSILEDELKTISSQLGQGDTH
jgi:uncharacterized protein